VICGHAEAEGKPPDTGSAHVQFLQNHYQIAYITKDLEAAMAILRDQYGAPEFKSLTPDWQIGRNTVWTSEGGDQESVFRGALTHIGGLTIELIEPHSGPAFMYEERLVPGQVLNFHHYGFRCDDIDAVRAESEEQGRPCVMMGGFKAARFMYVDARATLGCFLEYVQAPAEYWNR
jgi:hypothetical protein